MIKKYRKKGISNKSVNGKDNYWSQRMSNARQRRKSGKLEFVEQKFLIVSYCRTQNFVNTWVLWAINIYCLVFESLSTTIDFGSLTVDRVISITRIFSVDVMNLRC